MEEKIPTVQIHKGGPLVITGKIKVIKADGSEEIHEGTTAFCRCGQSKNMPFCDGSHKTSGFDK